MGAPTGSCVAGQCVRRAVRPQRGNNVSPSPVGLCVTTRHGPEQQPLQLPFVSHPCAYCPHRWATGSRSSAVMHVVIGVTPEPEVLGSNPAGATSPERTVLGARVSVTPRAGTDAARDTEGGFTLELGARLSTLPYLTPPWGSALSPHSLPPRTPPSVRNSHAEPSGMAPPPRSRRSTCLASVGGTSGLRLQWGRRGGSVEAQAYRKGGSFARGPFRRGKFRGGRGGSPSSEIPKLQRPHTHAFTCEPMLRSGSKSVGTFQCH